MNDKLIIQQPAFNPEEFKFDRPFKVKKTQKNGDIPIAFNGLVYRLDNDNQILVLKTTIRGDEFCRIHINDYLSGRYVLIPYELKETP